VLLSGYPVSVWPPFGILDLLAVPLWTTQDHDGTQRLVLAFDGLDLFALDDPGVCDALPVISFDWIWLGFAFLADIGAFVASAARRRDARWYTGP